MAEVTISRSEFDRLAEKLDSLGTQLNDEEKVLLLAVFRLAAEATARQTGEGAAKFAQGDSGSIRIEGAEGTQDLAAGFVDAFSGGRSAGEDLASAPEVTGTIKVGITF